MAAGATLNVGQTLKSPNGQSKLVLQGDGNLVVRVPSPLLSAQLYTASKILFVTKQYLQLLAICNPVTELLQRFIEGSVCIGSALEGGTDFVGCCAAVQGWRGCVVFRHGPLQREARHAGSPGKQPP